MSRYRTKRARTRDMGQLEIDEHAVNTLRNRGATLADAFGETATRANMRANMTYSTRVRQEATDAEWRAWQDRADELPPGADRIDALENQERALYDHVDALRERIAQETATSMNNQRLLTEHEQAALRARNAYNSSMPMAVMMQLAAGDISASLPGIGQAELAALVNTLRNYRHNKDAHEAHLRFIEDLNDEVTDRVKDLRAMREKEHERQLTCGCGGGGGGAAGRGGGGGYGDYDAGAAGGGGGGGGGYGDYDPGAAGAGGAGGLLSSARPADTCMNA